MRRMVPPLLAIVGLASVSAAPNQSGAATLTPLVSFCALANCTDGAYPVAGLIADANGDLLGTTEGGGAYGYGTVFLIAKTAQGYATTPTILVSFGGSSTDGLQPQAGLIADANGNLFGTTGYGGTHGGGTVFELAKTASGYSAPIILVSFCALAGCTDGSAPFAGLLADTNGNLFGTTIGGGAYFAGTVFEIAKTASGYAATPTILVSFGSSSTDGAYPWAGLIADTNGNLFGTTGNGGSGYGTVFEVPKSGNGYATTATILVSFCSLAGCTASDGAVPKAGLIADANGNLFGTTSEGGASLQGTVFKLAKTASGYANAPTVLASFCALAGCTDGSRPQAGLIADANGNLFGTTEFGGANTANSVGIVFEVTGSGFVVPAMFTGTPGRPNCTGESVSALAQHYGSLAAAAAALGYSSAQGLQKDIVSYCAQ